MVINETITSGIGGTEASNKLIEIPAEKLLPFLEKYTIEELQGKTLVIEIMEKHGMGYYLMLIAIILGIILIIALILYFNYKKSIAHPKEKPSTLSRVIIVSLIIILVIVLILFLTGSELKKIHIYLFVGIIFLVFIANLYELKKRRPLSFDKLKDKAIEIIRKELNALPIGETHYGSQFGHNYPFYKITETLGGRVTDSLANRIIFTNQGGVLVKNNIYDGECVHFQLNPPPDIIQEIWGQKEARRYIEELAELENVLKLEKSGQEGEEEK